MIILSSITFKNSEFENPRDTSFLFNISNINITLDQNIHGFSNILFCFHKENFLNSKKNYRDESFIIFTTLCQLKLLKNYFKQIFIDATFKIINY